MPRKKKVAVQADRYTFTDPVSPRVVVPQIEDIGPEDHESRIVKVRRGLQPILGEGVHIHFVREPKLDSDRLAVVQAGPPRFTPLRWSNLSPSQREQVENYIPYVGVDGLVHYGDLIVVTCPQAEWDAELVRKGRRAHQAYNLGPENVARQYAHETRDTGIRVDTQWPENAGGFTPPRPPLE